MTPCLARGTLPDILQNFRVLRRVTILLAKMLRLIVAVGLLLPLAVIVTLAGQAKTKKQTATADAAAGKKLFEEHCALCHGIDGRGGRGPSLNRVHLTHAADDEALKGVIMDGIAPNMPQGWYFDDDDVANLVAFVRSLSKVRPDPIPGDVTRGASVYVKSGCSGCHILDGAGTGYGPDLTAIGERRRASFLQQVISKPPAALPEDFLLVKATTPAGETVQGIRVNEDSFTIQIKDPSGRYHSFRKDELTELKKLRGETPMPSFEGILSATEIQDLVAYLASQRGKP